MESMRGLLRSDDYLIKQSKAFLDLERSMTDDYTKRYEEQYKGDRDRNEKKIRELQENQCRYSNDLIYYRRIIENILLRGENKLDVNSIKLLDESYKRVADKIRESIPEQ